MLLKLKAFSIPLSKHELYFGIGEPLRSQEREHLMSQLVWVHLLIPGSSSPGLQAYDKAARRLRRTSGNLEGI